MLLVASLAACATRPPASADNICQIFEEKSSWYKDSYKAAKKWNGNIYVPISIMFQESAFQAKAKPPVRWFAGIIPYGRPSDAYGYAQAQDGTWQDYLINNDHWGADRDEFSSASDFIGWYCSISHSRLGISLDDSQKLYLAYHEGHGGYSRKTYLKKHWLIKTAKKVSNKSRQYQSQLSSCKEELESSSWFFW